MQRNFSALSSRPFDLVVVGGGIYGACIAAEAATQGLDVCLVEALDFGHATSANSLHVMHGGLRYLQHLDLKRMRESIAARREWLLRYPALVEPMEFRLPTFGHALRGPELYRAAMLVNNAVGFDANQGLPPGRRLEPGRVLSRKAANAWLEALHVPGANGLAVWQDGFVVHPERVLLAIVAEAAAAGAVCCNYARAVDLVVEGGRVAGVEVVDEISGSSATVHARVVVDAAGPGTGYWYRREAERAEFLPSRAFNLLTRRLPFDAAVGLPIAEHAADRDAWLRKGHQTCFVIPYGEYSLVGTKHLPACGGDERVAPAEVAALVAEIDSALSGCSLTLDDVYRVYEGVLPANAPGSTGLAKSPVVRASGNISGLVTVVGVKWTTAPVVARQALALIARRWRLKSKRAPAAASAGSPYSAAGLREPVPPRMSASLDADAALATEVLHAVRHEMAETLADVVFRRTSLGQNARPDPAVVHRCAELIATERGWSVRRREAELEHVARELERLGRQVGRARTPVNAAASPDAAASLP